MSTGAYLIPSGFKEGTNLFVRAMSWGASDAGYGASLPSGAHQMVFINEEEPVFSNTKKTLISPTYNNGGFDITGTSPNEFEDWNSSAQPISQVEYDSTGAYSGDGALRLDVVSGNNVYVTNNKAVVTLGDTIEYEFWAKASDGTKNIAIQCGTVFYQHGATTEWQKFTGSFIASGTNILMIRKTFTVSYSLWVDNLTVRAVRPDNPTEYSLFADLGENYSGTASSGRGYLATFIKPSYESGFYISERWKYDTFDATSGVACASGFLSKLQEQPQGTLLVLSTNDEPAENANIFQTELENNWGAQYIQHVAPTGTNTQLENGPNGNPKFRSSYILVASKGQKKIYEDYANSGEGPVGFCGWIKNKGYETGIWYQEITGYLSSGVPDTGYAKDSIDWGSYGENQTVSAGGFFKTTSAGSYIFRVASDDASYMWFGDKSASGWNTGNAEISLGGFHAAQTGYYTGELEANTYYPIRFQYGNGVGTGEFRVYYRYENDAFSPYLPYYHINYQTGLNYYPENIGLASKYYQNMDALFSLYDLLGTNPNVVDVYRDIKSSGTTGTFTASEVSDGTMLNWVNETTDLFATEGTLTAGPTGTGTANAIIGDFNLTSSDQPNYTYEVGTFGGVTGALKINMAVGSDNCQIKHAHLLKHNQVIKIDKLRYWIPSGSSITRIRLKGDNNHVLLNSGVSSLNEETWYDMSGTILTWKQGQGGTPTYPTKFNLDADGGADIVFDRDIQIDIVSGNGYSSKWYNQLDNSKNAVQTNTGLMPMIVTGGNQAYDSSGNPSIWYDTGNGTGRCLEFPPITGTSGWSVAAVAERGVYSSYATILQQTDAANRIIVTNGGTLLYRNNNLNRSFAGLSNVAQDSTFLVNIQRNYSDVGTNQELFAHFDGNDSSLYSDTGTALIDAPFFRIGARHPSAANNIYNWQGYIGMIAIWTDEKKTPGYIIRDSIKNVYNI